MPGFSYTSTVEDTVATVTLRVYDAGIMAPVIVEQLVAAATRILAKHNGAPASVPVVGVANERDQRSDT